MKLMLVFMAVVAVCAGLSIPMLKDELLGVPGVKIADKSFLMKQKFILDVLYHLHMPMEDEYMKDVSGFVEGQEFYYDYDKVIPFFMMYKYGLLPRNYVFSIFNYRHSTELKGLFYLFYYSKDWPTFYRNVLWARHNVNEGMFVYALYAAVIHRKDMQGIILPAHYEVLPYMYFNGLTIDEILKYKTLGLSKIDKDIVILSKYTDEVNMINDENKLAYFTEDIGWNMYYFFFNLDYPHWLGGKDFGLYKDRRGEQYLYMHQQLLARYYLERLSNKMGEIPEFSWYTSIKTGYNSYMKYYNGLPFTVRKNYYEIFDTHDFYPVNRIEDFERRIREAIDIGYFLDFKGNKIDLWSMEGIDMLGNLIHSNPDSLNEQYFGKLIVYAHKMLGGGQFGEIFDYKVVPGVMEHYETMMRDPVFYQFYKKIVKFWFQYKSHLPAYKPDELFFPGVKITKVDVSKLVTYFDYFDIDVSTMMEVDKLWKGYDRKMMNMDYIKKDFMDMDHIKSGIYDKDYFLKSGIYDKDFLMDYDKDYHHTDKSYFSKMPLFDKYMKSKDYVMDDTMLFDKKYKDMDMKYDTLDMNVPWWKLDSHYKFKVRQWRLNHKPFTVNIELASDKMQKVVFRVFMGPKFDYMGRLININKNRENFVEIDQFVYDLKMGMNMIRRESRDFYFSVKDRTMYTDLYRMVMLGLQGKEFPLDMSEAHCGFPDRLLLPKGWVSGMPMQFFFIITPFKDVKTYSTYKYWFSCGIGSGTRFIDDLPFGYPFDRHIDETYFYTPNMYFKDIVIYHMEDMHKYSDIAMDKDMLMMDKTDMLYKYPLMEDSMTKYPFAKDTPLIKDSLYTKYPMDKIYDYPVDTTYKYPVDTKYPFIKDTYMKDSLYTYPYKKDSLYTYPYKKDSMYTYPYKKDSMYTYPYMKDSMYTYPYVKDSLYTYPYKKDSMYTYPYKKDSMYTYPYMKDSMYTYPYEKDSLYTYPYLKDSMYTYPYTKDSMYTYPYMKDSMYTYPYKKDSMYTYPYMKDTTYKYPDSAYSSEFMDTEMYHKYPWMKDTVYKTGPVDSMYDYPSVMFKSLFYKK